MRRGRIDADNAVGKTELEALDPRGKAASGGGIFAHFGGRALAQFSDSENTDEERRGIGCLKKRQHSGIGFLPARLAYYVGVEQIRRRWAHRLISRPVSRSCSIS